MGLYHIVGNANRAALGSEAQRSAIAV
jgi:hypothetical protein